LMPMETMSRSWQRAPQSTTPPPLRRLRPSLKSPRKKTAPRG
jgi:hypothetical protein